MKIIEANIDYEVIGNRIREARRNIGMSQEKLSEEIDVAVAYISRIERGKGKINLRRLSQISIVLKVPIETLISGSIVEEKKYLNKEFEELLSECTKEKQRLIYNIARIVSGMDFV